MKRKTLVFWIAALFIAGCAKKPPITPESEVDKPEYHYLQGMSSLEKEDFSSAIASFERSVGIDTKFGDGYAGLALTYAEMGQKTKAKDNLEKSFDCEPKTARMYLLKGRVITRLQSGKKWLKKAIDSFDKANELDADPSKIYFYRGMAYQSAKQYESAAAEYRKVIDKKGAFTEKADERYKKMQILVRVSPGTVVGESIAVMGKITRAELAALLCTEFKIEEVYNRFGIHHYDLTYSPYEKTELNLPKDATDHWANQWIILILELGVMEIYPDGQFKPDAPLKRYEYAMAVQSILVNLQKDREMARKYIGEKSRFPDVKADHFAYNAMALGAERGIITPDKINGVYKPEAPVSGLEALEIIKIFRNKLTINF